MSNREINKIFDEDQGVRDQYAEHLKTLTEHAGWKLMEQVIDANVEYLEKQILDKKNAETGQPLTDEQEEEMRKLRSLNLELKRKPFEIIEMLKNVKEETSDDLDPYYRDGAEIQAERDKSSSTKK